MHFVSSFVSTSLSAAGTAFYSHTVSRCAAEEESLHSLSMKTHEVISGIFDTLSGLIVKVLPQTFFILALSSQVHHHLATIGAPQSLLSVAGVAGRILPFLPLLLATAPLIGLADSYFKKNSEAEKKVEDGLEGLERGRSFQKLGNYISRSLEIAFAVLLTSRVIHNDGRLAALVGIATLIAGFVYRNDMLKQSYHEPNALLGKVFTWEPNEIPYALGGAAVIAGPSSLNALFLLSLQGIRDHVLNSGSETVQISGNKPTKRAN